MQKVAEFLIEAKKVIEDPTRWTTGWFAKTVAGVRCSALDDEATCFCSMGALEYYNGRELLYDEKGTVAHLARDVLESVMEERLVSFNDRHSHTEVMQKWAEAIKFSQKEGS